MSAQAPWPLMAPAGAAPWLAASLRRDALAVLGSAAVHATVLLGAWQFWAHRPMQPPRQPSAVVIPLQLGQLRLLAEAPAAPPPAPSMEKPRQAPAQRRIEPPPLPAAPEAAAHPPAPVVPSPALPAPEAPPPVAHPAEAPTAPALPSPVAAAAAEAPASATPHPPVRKAQPDYAHNPPPDYPRLLREQGVGGVVWLRVWVQADGQPGDITVSKGSGYRLLDESALRAVRQWRFLPARHGSQALASWVEFPVRFSISG